MNLPEPLRSAYFAFRESMLCRVGLNLKARPALKHIPAVRDKTSCAFSGVVDTWMFHP